MRIGIIGAENSHTAAIAKTINVDKLVSGVSVDYVWGETPVFARDAATKGGIPNIVKKPREMMGKIDALIVDHRHPKYHLPAALPFVRRGIPTFIDKPFCYRSEQGKAFIAEAKKAGAPITSFSVLPHQRTFMRFVRKIQDLGKIVAAGTSGASDLKSKYGGVFFYGIHQVDMALVAFGYNVKAAGIVKNGKGNCGQLIYDDGKIVTLDLITAGSPGFGIRAIGEKGIESVQVKMDKVPYLTGIRTFVKMFRTGVEPIPHEHMLMPVQVLETLERSVKSGQIEKVVK